MEPRRLPAQLASPRASDGSPPAFDAADIPMKVVGAPSRPVERTNPLYGSDDDATPTPLPDVVALRVVTLATFANRQLSADELKRVLPTELVPLKNARDPIDVDLSGNRLGADGAAFVGGQLAALTALTSLNLSGCGCGDDGAAALATALFDHASLRSLDLPASGMTARGADALADLILKSRALTILKLTDNDIGRQGAESIVKSASASSRAKLQLHLARNRIGVDGAQAIGRALRSDRCISVLDLADNGLAEGVTTIADSLERNTTLVELNLSGNNVLSNDHTVRRLTAALAKNAALCVLRINGASDDAMSPDAARHLMKGAAASPSLAVLDIKPKLLDGDARDRLRSTLERNAINYQYLHAGLTDATKLSSAYLSLDVPPPAESKPQSEGASVRQVFVDDDVIMSCTKDGYVRLLKIAADRGRAWEHFRRTEEYSSGDERVLAVLPAGATGRVLAAFKSGSVRTFDRGGRSDSAAFLSPAATSVVRCMAGTAGRIFTASLDGKLRVHDNKSGQLTATVPIDDRVSALCVEAGSADVAYTGHDNGCILVLVATDTSGSSYRQTEKLSVPQDHPVTALCCDRKWLCSGSDDWYIRLWSRPSGGASSHRCVYALNTGAPVACLALSWHTLFCGTTVSLNAWRISDEEEPQRLERSFAATSASYDALCVSNDGRLLFSASGDGDKNSLLRVWDLASQTTDIESVKILRVPAVTCLALREADNDYAVVGGTSRGQVLVWSRAKDNEPTVTVVDPSVALEDEDERSAVTGFRLNNGVERLCVPSRVRKLEEFCCVSGTGDLLLHDRTGKLTGLGQPVAPIRAMWMDGTSGHRAIYCGFDQGRVHIYGDPVHSWQIDKYSVTARLQCGQSRVTAICSNHHIVAVASDVITIWSKKHRRYEQTLSVPNFYRHDVPDFVPVVEHLVLKGGRLYAGLSDYTVVVWRTADFSAPECQLFAGAVSGSKLRDSLDHIVQQNRVVDPSFSALAVDGDYVYASTLDVSGIVVWYLPDAVKGGCRRRSPQQDRQEAGLRTRLLVSKSVLFPEAGPLTALAALPTSPALPLLVGGTSRGALKVFLPKTAASIEASVKTALAVQSSSAERGAKDELRSSAGAGGAESVAIQPSADEPVVGWPHFYRAASLNVSKSAIVSIATDGGVLVTADEQHAIRSFNTDGPLLTFEVPKAETGRPSSEAEASLVCVSPSPSDSDPEFPAYVYSTVHTLVEIRVLATGELAGTCNVGRAISSLWVDDKRDRNLVYVGGNKEITVWEMPKKRPSAPLQCHRLALVDAAQDERLPGTVVAMCGSVYLYTAVHRVGRDVIYIWDRRIDLESAEHECLYALDFPDGVNCLHLSMATGRLFAGGFGVIVMWDVSALPLRPTEARIRTTPVRQTGRKPEAERDVQAIASDGNYVFFSYKFDKAIDVLRIEDTRSQDATLGELSVVRLQRLVPDSAALVTALLADSSESGTVLYSTHDDGSVTPWRHVSSLAVRDFERLGPEVTPRCLTQDELRLYVGMSDDRILVYDKLTGAPAEGSPAEVPAEYKKKAFDGAEGFTCLAIGETQLIAALATAVIGVWDKESLEFRYVLPNKYHVRDGHTRKITSVAVDGKLLYSASLDGTVRVWHLKRERLERVIRCAGCLQVRFDHQWIYVGCDDGLLHRYKKSDPDAPPITSRLHEAGVLPSCVVKDKFGTVIGAAHAPKTGSADAVTDMWITDFEVFIVQGRLITVLSKKGLAENEVRAKIIIDFQDELVSSLFVQARPTADAAKVKSNEGQVAASILIYATNELGQLFAFDYRGKMLKPKTPAAVTIESEDGGIRQPPIIWRKADRRDFPEGMVNVGWDLHSFATNGRGDPLGLGRIEYRGNLMLGKTSPSFATVTFGFEGGEPYVRSAFEVFCGVEPGWRLVWMPWDFDHGLAPAGFVPVVGGHFKTGEVLYMARGMHWHGDGRPTMLPGYAGLSFDGCKGGFGDLEVTMSTYEVLFAQPITETPESPLSAPVPLDSPHEASTAAVVKADPNRQLSVKEAAELAVSQLDDRDREVISKMVWVPRHGKSGALGMIGMLKAGHDLNPRDTLYIGRGMREGTVQIGKAAPSLDGIQIGYKNGELALPDYQLLAGVDDGWRLEWITMDLKRDGKTPPGRPEWRAVPAGRDDRGRLLYIARFKHQHNGRISLCPGAASFTDWPAGSGCQIGFGNGTHYSMDRPYEVLCCSPDPKARFSGGCFPFSNPRKHRPPELLFGEGGGGDVSKEFPSEPSAMHNLVNTVLYLSHKDKTRFPTNIVVSNGLIYSGVSNETRKYGTVTAYDPLFLKVAGLFAANGYDLDGLPGLLPDDIKTLSAARDRKGSTNSSAAVHSGFDHTRLMAYAGVGDIQSVRSMHRQRPPYEAWGVVSKFNESAAFFALRERRWTFLEDLRHLEQARLAQLMNAEELKRRGPVVLFAGDKATEELLMDMVRADNREFFEFFLQQFIKFSQQAVLAEAIRANHSWYFEESRWSRPYPIEVDPNAVNTFGSHIDAAMSLYLACYYGRANIVQLLRDREDVSTNNIDARHGRSALHVCHLGARESEFADLAEAHPAKYAKLELRLIAARSQCFEILRGIENGVQQPQFLERDASGMTAYDYALQRHAEMIERMKQPLLQVHNSSEVRRVTTMFKLTSAVLDQYHELEPIKDHRQKFANWHWVRKAGPYLLFMVACLVACLYNATGNSDYFAAMNQGLVNNFNQGLDGVTDIASFYTWLDSTTFSTVYGNTDGNNKNFVASYNELLGSVRLKQLRTKTGTCDRSKFAGLNGPDDRCISPDFDAVMYPDLAETEDFVGTSTNSTYRWSANDDDFPYQTYRNTGVKYPNGGYVIDFPANLNLTAARDSLATIQADSWVRPDVRLLTVTWTVYNENYDLFGIVRCAFVFGANGFVSSDFVATPVRAANYRSFDVMTEAEIAIAIVEMAILLYFIWEFPISEAREVWEKVQQTRQYLRAVWALKPQLELAMLGPSKVKEEDPNEIVYVQIQPGKAMDINPGVHGWKFFNAGAEGGGTVEGRVAAAKRRCQLLHADGFVLDRDTGICYPKRAPLNVVEVKSSQNLMAFKRQRNLKKEREDQLELERSTGPVAQEMRKLRSDAIVQAIQSYVLDPWNIFEYVCMGTFTAAFALRLIRVVLGNDMSLVPDPSVYLNLSGVGFYWQLETSFFSIFVMLIWLRFIKFLAIPSFTGPMVQSVIQTLSNQAVVVFLVVVFFCLVAMTVPHLVMFGDVLPNYRTYFTTLMVMVRKLFGDMDFDDMNGALDTWAPVAYLLFIVIANLVLLNLLVGVLSAAYGDAIERNIQRWDRTVTMLMIEDLPARRGDKNFFADRIAERNILGAVSGQPATSDPAHAASQSTAKDALVELEDVRLLDTTELDNAGDADGQLAQGHADNPVFWTTQELDDLAYNTSDENAENAQKAFESDMRGQVLTIKEQLQAQLDEQAKVTAALDASIRSVQTALQEQFMQQLRSSMQQAGSLIVEELLARLDTPADKR